MSDSSHTPGDPAPHGGPVAHGTPAKGRPDRPFDPAGIQRIPTSARWAREVGYCRAIRAGDRILVSGTAPVADDGTTAFPGDAGAQTRRCLEILAGALGELGAGLHQVVRTRIYVTDIGRWEKVGRAHGDVFRNHPPVTTMVEVKGLIAPDMLVEIEAEAWVGGGTAHPG
jgi:enamine deaminase RidA (YjgF/YER057c/UK114 family)